MMWPYLATTILAPVILFAGCGSGAPLYEEADTTFPSPYDAEETASASDPDGDGFVGERDQCPDEAEDFDGLGDRDGCPETDHDEDGWLDEDDACPSEHHNVPVYPETLGCPWLENTENCGGWFPLAPGVPSAVAPTLRFAPNGLEPTDRLDLLAEPIVKIVTYHLAQDPEGRIAIVGSAHDDEDDHQALACRRADWMFDFLTERGVDPARLDRYARWGWLRSAVAYPPCHYLPGNIDIECLP